MLHIYNVLEYMMRHRFRVKELVIRALPYDLHLISVKVCVFSIPGVCVSEQWRRVLKHTSFILYAVAHKLFECNIMLL